MGSTYRVLIYDAPNNNEAMKASLVKQAQEEKAEKAYGRIDVFTGVVKEKRAATGQEEEVYKMLVMLPTTDVYGDEIGPPPWYSGGDDPNAGILKEHFICELQLELSKGSSMDDSVERTVRETMRSLAT